MCLMTITQYYTLDVTDKYTVSLIFIRYAFHNSKNNQNSHSMSLAVATTDERTNERTKTKVNVSKKSETWNDSYEPTLKKNLWNIQSYIKFDKWQHRPQLLSSL